MFDFMQVPVAANTTAAFLLDQDGEPSHYVSFYADEVRTRILARSAPVGFAPDPDVLDLEFRNTLSIYNHDGDGTKSRQLDQVVDY